MHFQIKNTFEKQPQPNILYYMWWRVSISKVGPLDVYESRCIYTPSLEFFSWRRNCVIGQPSGSSISVISCHGFYA